MSNELKVETVKIRDATALAKAVARMKQRGKNVELVANGRCRLWGKQTKVCPYVILNLDGRFDIGFEANKDKDGVYYTMCFDDWNGDVAKIAGRELEGVIYNSGHVRNEDGYTRTKEELTMSSVNQLTQDYHEELFAAVAQSHGYSMATIGEEEDRALEFYK